MSWVPRTIQLKNKFAKKLDLFKRSECLPKSILEQFYSKVIFSSISYGLIIWSAGNDSDTFQSMERLHCRVAKIIYNFPKHSSSAEALGLVKCFSLLCNYKLVLLKTFYKAFHNK